METNQPKTHSKPVVTIQLSAWMLAAIGIVLAAGIWGISAKFSTKNLPDNKQSNIKPAHHATTNHVTEISTKDATWGRLHAKSFTIERPDAFLGIPSPFTEKARWIFEKQNRQEVTAIFDRIGLTADQKVQLLAPDRCKETVDGLDLIPDHKIVRELSREARTSLYAILGSSSINPRHHSPFTVPENWLSDLQLTQTMARDTYESINNLLYRRGNVICFADMPALFDVVTDPLERRNVVKALSRRPALLVNLHITEDANMDEIIGYWSRGWHAKDLRSLLNSLSREQEDVSLDIIHLLPPFARERVYTFPYPQLGSNEEKPNCYWTALNFFSTDQPDARFTHIEAAKAKLDKDYYPITDKPALGDVICLIDSQGELFHMANYIAANIVFTKNGYHHHNPWVLATTEDMIANYPAQQPITTLSFRRKDTPQAATP